MNQIVYFDLYNSIKDVQEGFTIAKILRNNKRLLTGLSGLVSLVFAIEFKEKFFKTLPIGEIMLLIDCVLTNYLEYAFDGDTYKEDAEKRLIIASTALGNMNVSTSDKLLKEADCYHRVYNLKFNKEKTLQLIESKYILVPAYNGLGNITNVSILQEHVVGSKEYVLSLGTPKRALVPVTSKV